MSSSLLSSPCVVEKCELASLALCQCCKKDLCIDHLNEHANQRNEKLLPFVDKINVLLERFSKFYDGEQTVLRQLDDWRQDAYRLVDGLYEKKRQEFLDETTDKQREQLNQMHNNLKELIRKKGGSQQDFDTFSENMQAIEQYLDRLQRAQLQLPPLTIDDRGILRPVASQASEPAEEKTVTPSAEQPAKTSKRKKSSDKPPKKKKKSARRSDESSDRSSHNRSRSPRNRSDRSRRRRDKASDSDSSQDTNNKQNCNDCRGCRFYQDRFGPGFMDSFGPCSCDCHKWAYS